MHRENLKKNRLQGLSDFIGVETLVRIDRKPLASDLIEGFIVGMSEKLLLLHVLNDPMILLDGYTAVRLADIRSFEVKPSFFETALRLSDQRPVVPDSIDITDLTTLLTSIQNFYPVVAIQLENKDPGCLFIGPITKQTKKHVELSKIDTHGQYLYEEVYPLKDITSVEFDTAYLAALGKVVEYLANSEE